MSILNPEAGGADRPAPADIWRTWLVTGARAHPIDRRRLQGEHRGLKQLLAEGGEADVISRPWRDFSRAMVRQSVNEAMGRLTARERVVLTMAYFAGFSNQEIADELGMTDRGVQRSLRRSLDRLSSVLERSRRIALGLVAAVAAGRIGQWLREGLSTAHTQAIAAAVVVSVVAVAPSATAAHGAGAPRSVHAQSAQSAGAAPVAPAASQPAGSQPSTPSGAPAVAAPRAPLVTVPSISLPRPPVVVVKLPRISLKNVL